MEAENKKGLALWWQEPVTYKKSKLLMMFLMAILAGIAIASIQQEKI